MLSAHDQSHVAANEGASEDSRPTEQPVMNAAAAGGKMMATMMRRMSEPRTGIVDDC